MFISPDETIACSAARWHSKLKQRIQSNISGREAAVATQEKSIEVGALKWFYREAEPLNPTDKSPVLLLHGLPAQSYGWRHILPALAEQGLRSIAPDWIGFGFSAKPDKRDFAYTPDAYIQALQALLQTLGIDRFSLVLQGFIGSVGLQYALRYPEQIERLAILNAPLTPEAKLPWKIKQLGLPLVGEMLTQDPLLVDRTLEGGGGYRVEDADLDVYRRPFLKSSDAGRALFAAVRNLQLPQAMAELQAGFANWQQPTLVVWGIKDPWLPLSMAEAFVKAIDTAQLVQLEEVGHYPQEDWHEKVSAALSPFLRRAID
jgi:pimeloyl-ACP methyl ester carboxylesterase